MKKTYITPQTEIIKVDSESLLASLSDINGDTIGGGSEPNVPGNGGSDEGNNRPVNAPSRRGLWED